MDPHHLNGYGRRRGGQAGVTLIESLVAIALVSIAVLGIAAGLLVTVTSSAHIGGGVRAMTALQAASERIRDLPYRSCATVADLTADYAGAPAPLGGPTAAQVTILSVRQWDAAGGTFAAPDICGNDAGIHLVRFRVDIGGASSTGEVVQRNPAVRPA